jgi:hypothetical protein
MGSRAVVPDVGVHQQLDLTDNEQRQSNSDVGRALEP